MVKVFLRESATACLEQLKALYTTLPQACILVPNPTYQRNCIEAGIKTVSIFTLSQWMELLKLRPLKTEDCLFLNTYDHFEDPADTDININFSESFKQEWCIWMKTNNIHPFSAIHNTPVKHLPFTSAILYGNFKVNTRTILVQNLKNLNIKCYQITHTEGNFSANDTFEILEKSNNFQSISTKNITSERIFVQKFLQENQDTVCVQLPGQSYAPLLQTPADKQLTAWLDWQEQGNLSHFLIYLKNILEPNTDAFHSIKIQLEQAASIVLSDNFTLLQSYYLNQNNYLLESYKQGNWPKEAPFLEFLEILQKVLPDNLKNFFSSLPYLPFTTTKEHFFSYLHRWVYINESTSKQIKRFEEVLYFPFNKYLIPNCIQSTQEKINHRIYSFVTSTILENKKLTVCASKTDKNKAEVLALFPYCKTFEFPLKNQGTLKSKTNLSLPSKVLQKLSCKNWERFYLSPLQTWLETILKTQKIPLHFFRIKSKIIGEWVHQNLQFDKKPNAFEDWLQCIQKNATERLNYLQKNFEYSHQPMPQVFETWHQKSLFYSQQMATACQDLLNWELQSEWSLPSNASIKGRIDLLAIRKHEAVVVDYKTSLHYLFTPKQINKGHGLQLWLYGSYLRSIGKSVRLRIVDPFGKSTQLDFEQTQPELTDIESWLASIQNSGIYTYLPDEKKEMLPLCL